MLPPFHDGMYLPAGDHPATWEDIIGRFCGGARRQGFCNRLQAFLERARNCGFLKVYLFGSFISGKTDPGDVDLLWVYREGLDLNALRKDCYDLLNYGLNKEQERWDMWCCSDNDFVINYLMEGWRKNKPPDNQARGVIILDLAGL